MSTFLKPGDVATMLGMSEKTLAKWRCLESDKIPFVKIGHSVRYLLDDVEGYAANRRRVSTSDPGPAPARN